MPLIRVFKLVIVVLLFGACATNQDLSGYRVAIHGHVAGTRRRQPVDVSVVANSGRVLATRQAMVDGSFFIDDARLLPATYWLEAFTRDRKFQGVQRLNVPSGSFQQSFEVNIKLEEVPHDSIEAGAFPLHITFSQLFATDRDLHSRALTARRGTLVFGRRDIELPIADNVPVVYRSVTPLQEADFAHELNNSISSSTNKEVLLYIHGYNNTLNNAALSVAQIQHGAKFTGTAVFFSWPSRGRLLAYWTDEREAQKSADDFLRYLRIVLNSTATKVTVIAHSMGNRIATEAIARIAVEPMPARRIHNLILAAADIDPDTLDKRLPAILQIADRVTIYFSRNDKATAASKVVHKTSVVGHDGVFPAKDAVDVVDATRASHSFLGHSYLEDSAVLHDIYDLVNDDKRAAKRQLDAFDDFYRINLTCRK